MRSLRAAALAGALLLPGAAFAQLPGSAHWKSTIEVEGGNQQGVGPMQSEIWLKSGIMRTKMQVMGMTRNMLKSGDTMYQWAEGEKTGMKFSAAVQQRQGPSGDYANRIDEYRTKGKKTGSEKIDGHPCDIYELTTSRSDGHDREHKETVWLATDLYNFALKVISESNGTRVTTRNSDVEFKASVPDAMMKPPADVTFQDMSEMMKGMRPPRQ
jgi:outer membrane lipoprotein-sorting protein